jgi:hypothetical protein
LPLVVALLVDEEKFLLMLTRRTRRNGEIETVTRAWVVWRLIEHDLPHGGEISQILEANGIPALDP